MRVLMVILMALFCAGCSQTMWEPDIQKGLEMCEANGGIESFKVDAPAYNNQATCKNGARFILNED